MGLFGLTGSGTRGGGLRFDGSLVRVEGHACCRSRCRSVDRHELLVACLLLRFDPDLVLLFLGLCQDGNEIFGDARVQLETLRELFEIIELHGFLIARLHALLLNTAKSLERL